MLKLRDCWDSQTHGNIIDYTSNFLWRFIQPNAKESVIEETVHNLIGLRNSEIKTLVDIRLLLSDSVKHLIDNIAPKIIARLSKSSMNEYVIGRNTIRGRIDWYKTTNIRAVSGNDMSLFVYSQRSPVYDLPENRLFLYLLQLIYNKARNFSTDDFLRLTWYAEIEKGQKWINSINVIASKTRKIIQNSLVSNFGNLSELNTKMIEYTKKSRSPLYREMADIAEKILESQRSPINYLKNELDGKILEPLNKDTLYEIAVLFKTIMAAKNCGWIEKQFGLIGGRSKFVSTLVKNNYELRLYFQKLPNAMAQISKYGDIMQGYGLSEKLRRPDIVIEISDGISNRFIIVEVKRSKNRRYLVDGTYKLLGYLKDFEFLRSESTSLDGILVGWDNIKYKEYSPLKEAHLYSWNNYDIGLSTMLNEIVK